MKKSIKIVVFVITAVLVTASVLYITGYLYLESKLKEEKIIPSIEKKTTIGGEIEVMEHMLGITISAPLSVPVSEVAKKATEVAGFKVYYPSYVPKEIQLDQAQINISPEKNFATCELGDAYKSGILIIQRSIKSESDKSNALKKIDVLEGKKEVSINDTTAYIGVLTSDTNVFNKILYITPDNVFIEIRANANYFNSDTLVKVAESLE